MAKAEDVNTSFYKDGACKGASDLTVNFFPRAGDNQHRTLEICASCVVRVECLTYALLNPNLKGIWGAANERQRNRLRRQVLGRMSLDEVRQVASSFLDQRPLT